MELVSHNRGNYSLPFLFLLFLLVEGGPFPQLPLSTGQLVRLIRAWINNSQSLDRPLLG